MSPTPESMARKLERARALSRSLSRQSGELDLAVRRAQRSAAFFSQLHDLYRTIDELELVLQERRP